MPRPGNVSLNYVLDVSTRDTDPPHVKPLPDLFGCRASLRDAIH